MREFSFANLRSYISFTEWYMRILFSLAKNRGVFYRHWWDSYQQNWINRHKISLYFSQQTWDDERELVSKGGYIPASLFERCVNLGQPHQSWLDHSAGEDAATMAAWRLGNSLMWRYYGMYGHIWGWRYWCNFQRWGRAEHANPPKCSQVMQYYRNLANPTMNHPQWRFILGFTTLLSNYIYIC